jgi:energy-coupling factor transport system permease protein
MLFDLYVPANGWLQSLDPRTKLAMVFCGAVLFVVIDRVLALSMLLVAVHVLLLTSQVPVSQIWWVWRQLLRVIVIIVGLWPLFAGMPGPLLFSLGPFTVTVGDLLSGLTTAMRVVGMSLLFFVILFTTRQNELVRGLVRLGLPFEWGLTLAIALRYVPTFTRTATQIQEAQAARGWQVARGNVIGRLRGMIPVLVALVISVLRTSDTLGMALAARGVGSGRPRTVWRDVHMGRRDWLVLTLVLLIFGLVIYARWAFGLGAEPY